MSLGKRIQSYRKQKGLSQEQLASRLNISRQALSKWESDINVPNIDKIMDVAKALEITLNELLGLEEDSNDEYAKLESILNQVVLTQIFKNGFGNWDGNIYNSCSCYVECFK